MLTSSRSDEVHIQVEPGAHEGKPAAHLSVTSGHGSAVLSQAIHADAYRGQRVRLSGAVRCREVTSWAGLWMRVDDTERRPIAFDNMLDRPFTGTRDWSTHAIVLDVHALDSLRIVFGLILNSTGDVWLADLRLDIVGPEVATTCRPLTPVYERPVNLDFTP